MTQKHPIRIIKRYQNRKLYDTSDSCYVTLDDICEMIKRGDDLEIIDNTTKEDLTAVTLAQIIFEQQKRKTQVLPLGTFRHIIQGSGEALRDLVSRGAKEIGHVREFVDDKVMPAVGRTPEGTAIKTEIEVIKKRLQLFKKEYETLERKLASLEKQIR